MITVKEEFVGCDKYRRAIKLGGPDAILMWLALKAYCAKYLTDGFVPEEEIDQLEGAPKRARDRALRALLECGRRHPNGNRGAGLVERTAHGWQLHDYLDHAESAEDIRDKRRKEADRKREYRSRKRNDSAGSVPESQQGQGVGQGTGQPNGTERGRPVGDSPAGARTRIPSPAQPTQDTPLPPKGGKPSRTTKRAKRRTAMVLDWQVPDALIAWCREQGLTDQQIRTERDGFVDFWISDGGLKADWPATFRNRIRSGLQSGRIRPASGEAGSQTSLLDDSADLFDDEDAARIYGTRPEAQA